MHLISYDSLNKNNIPVYFSTSIFSNLLIQCVDLTSVMKNKIQSDLKTTKRSINTRMNYFLLFTHETCSKKYQIRKSQFGSRKYKNPKQ
jgi:hypothetical protein